MRPARRVADGVFVVVGVILADPGLQALGQLRVSLRARDEVGVAGNSCQAWIDGRLLRFEHVSCFDCAERGIAASTVVMKTCRQKILFEQDVIPDAVRHKSPSAPIAGMGDHANRAIRVMRDELGVPPTENATANRLVALTMQIPPPLDRKPSANCIDHRLPDVRAIAAIADLETFGILSVSSPG